MEHYKNLDGDSGVLQYENGSDYIWVVFSDGARYQYTYGSAGAENIETMKKLAVAGRGLNSFIMKNPAVRKGFAQKVR
ncbi:hypothetical protein [Burkholderia sp. Ac-20379]|uniref:hypothetical protein n=1 Tax=Burkholderia sp. Ac-20379 TaxID=2703900 RepID=UPI00198068F8|nr:hypothetical protein [Burkholderia sp. Ac-20379]MBN3724362.1 hypothetical protein [Burkholderia sp. Ac-20379]